MARARPAGTPKTEFLRPPSLNIAKTACREGHLVHIHFIITATFFFFPFAILFLPLLLLVHSVQGGRPVLELHQGPEPQVILRHLLWLSLRFQDGTAAGRVTFLTSIIYKIAVFPLFHPTLSHRLQVMTGCSFLTTGSEATFILATNKFTY